MTPAFADDTAVTVCSQSAGEASALLHLSGWSGA